MNVLQAAVLEKSELQTAAPRIHSAMLLSFAEYGTIIGPDPGVPFNHRIWRLLEGALVPSGFGYYQCGRHYRTVNCHTAAIGTALYESHHIGLSSDKVDEYRHRSRLAFDYLLKQQQPEGSFPHSRGDYRIICDHRRYPRYLAMMLYHLLCVARGEKRDLKPET